MGVQRFDPFWEPFREFDELWNRMVSRFLDGPSAGGWQQGWTPLVDVEETDGAWVFELDLPGVHREDIRVEASDQELIISGEIKERERGGVLRHRTRRTGSFNYRTALPAGVDPDRVEAKFDNGVLTVRVPRPEHTKSRQIKIKLLVSVARHVTGSRLLPLACRALSGPCRSHYAMA